MKTPSVTYIPIFILVVLCLTASAVCANDHHRTLLNGEWEYGLDRNYASVTVVPGIVLDPGRHYDEKLWYRREVVLPDGNWKNASLELYGARFQPEVYVNGESVSKHNGGMARTIHELKHRAVSPGAKIMVEIALTPLKHLPQTDASHIPATDQWRSNMSSCLWDDVVLHVYGGVRVERAIPWFNLAEKRITLKYDACGEVKGITADVSVLSREGKILLQKRQNPVGGENRIDLDYKGVLKEWSPDEPNLYTLRIELKDGRRTVDVLTQNLGIKEFTCRDKKFFLNGDPCSLRGGTVVWHRWMRDAEGRDVGYDTTWFRDNVVLRLKDHGANYLRFHLGVPPQKLLDLCDRYGLLVQYEWSFFHGMPASRESLQEQYPVWFETSFKHPSIAIYHPYNETEGEQLQIVWRVLDEIVQAYPPLVLEERDVLHIHKYWWSLFENLGLYYDSYDQFDRAIIVDEFGGNYLDGEGEMGGYTSLKESYLRFMGRNSTRQTRLNHLAQSNGRVAEYWRRIGAAGVAPFTIASSWEDGNTWFLGPLREGRPKSVWNALTVAWSPVAASLDLWDRNFAPGQKVTVPVHLFNDTAGTRDVEAEVCVRTPDGNTLCSTVLRETIPPYSDKRVPVELTMPVAAGAYFAEARLVNPPAEVKYPVVSAWDIRVLEARIPDGIKNISVEVPEDEKELVEFAARFGFGKPARNKKPDILLLSRTTWDKVAGGDEQTGQKIRDAIHSGSDVLMLDVGERYLGQGYPSKAGDLGPLQGVARVTEPMITHHKLFDGFSLTFTESAEPESHLHPDPNHGALWNHIPVHYTWIWNGMRGGLLSPAADMEIHGMASDAFVAQWQARGADPEMMRSGNYYAYELYGFYGFSTDKNDKKVQKELKGKVEFLVLDAPALAGSINLRTPVKITDLASGYKNSVNGIAKKFTVLANAGKNLTRTPVVLVDFGEGKGRMIMSQLLTSGRLAPGYGETGHYGVRYDECAVQLVLNMIEIINTEN